MPIKKKLSSELEAIIGKKEASRTEVMRQLWAYLLENNLQCEDNSKYFVPDEKMYKIFGTEKIKKSHMTLFIDVHLSQIDSDDAKEEELEGDDAADDSKNDSNDAESDDDLKHIKMDLSTANNDPDDIYCARMTNLNGSHVWDIRSQEPQEGHGNSNYTLYTDSNDANDVSDDADLDDADADSPDTRTKKTTEVKKMILLSQINVEDPEGDDDIVLNQETWKKEPKQDGDAKELN